MPSIGVESAISEVATDSIVLEGKDRVKKISGKLAAATYLPGQAVHMSAQDVWIHGGGKASAMRMQVGWIEFQKRTTSTYGEVDIDATYTDSTIRNVEIIVGPRDGTVKLAILCEDLGQDAYYGEVLRPHSGGTMELIVGAHTAVKACMITEDGYKDTSTVARVYMI